MTTDTPAFSEPLPGDHPADGYRFTLVEYDDRADECTISPRGVDRDRLLTAWITVRREAVVDLESVR